MKRKLVYLLFIIVAFICFNISVSAVNLGFTINKSETAADKYDKYYLKISATNDGEPLNGSYSTNIPSITVTFNNGIANIVATNGLFIDLPSGTKVDVIFDPSYDSTRYTLQEVTNDVSFPVTLDEDTVTVNYAIQTFELKFDKYWEDEGYENYRPESSEFYLYNKNDQATLLDTVTLDSSDALEDDDSHWVGKFENFPYLDEDGNRIEYVVREKTHSNYINTYDSDEGLKIVFNEKTDLHTRLSTKIWVKKDNDYYIYNGVRNASTFIEEIINNQIFINTKSLEHFSRSSSSEFKQLIGASDSKEMKELVGFDYPETAHNFPIGETHLWHYRNTASSHTQDFYMSFYSGSWTAGWGVDIDNIVTLGNETVLTSLINLTELEVSKEWEDEGYESYRPNSVTYDIYNDKDNTKVRTVTLSKDNKVTDNEWKLKVENLPKYNDDQTEIEYKVVEKPVENYFTLYDYTDYYNGLSVTYSDDTQYSIDFCYEENGDTKCLNRWGGKYDSINEGNPLNGRTINIFSKKLVLGLYADNQISEKLKINDIGLVHVDTENEYTNGDIRNNNFYLGTHTYNDYIDIKYGDLPKNYYKWIYEWNGSIIPRKNATRVRNLINIKDIKFVKKWKDEGFENLRPNKVKFYLYNEKNMNKIVSEIELTADNEDSNDSYIWNGVFEKVPKYNEDGTEAKYIIEEEKLENYITKYDLSEKNGLLVSFDDKTFIDLYDYLKTCSFINDSNYKTIYDSRIFDYDYYHNDMLAGKTVYLPISNGFINKVGFYLSGSNASKYGFKINSIIPVKNTSDIIQVGSTNSLGQYLDYVYASGDQFPESNHPYSEPTMYMYESQPISNPFADADIIVNEINLKKLKVTKKWEDEDLEEFRPKSIKINFYNEKDKSKPIISDNLTIDDKIDDYTWEKEYNNLVKYDENGEEINYIIEEEKIDNYSTLYDSDEYFNGLAITFSSTSNLSEINAFCFKEDDVNKCLKISGSVLLLNDGGTFNIAGNTIKIPTRDFYVLYRNIQNFDIVNIEPAHVETLEFNIYNNDLPSVTKEATLDEYLSLNVNPPVEPINLWHYTWSGNKEPFKNSTKIINKSNLTNYQFSKVWDDLGYEYARPKSVKFSLYNNKDNSLVKEITLTDKNKDTYELNIWNGEFKGIPKYNDDNTLAEYYVKEEVIDNYTTKYEFSNIKGYLVKFTNDSNLTSNSFIGLESNGKKYMVLNKLVGNSINPAFYNNNTVYIPAMDISSDKLIFITTPTEKGMKIESIVPVNYNDSNYVLNETTLNIPENVFNEMEGDKLPESINTTTFAFYKYSLINEYDEPKIGLNKIKNSIKLNKVIISKVDESDNNIKGAKLSIINSEGIKAVEFTSTDKDKEISLPSGKYTLKEEKAPNGYGKAKNIEFILDKDGNILINGKNVDIIKMIDRKAEVKTVNTLDNINKYLFIFIGSIIAIILVLIVKRKTIKNM